MSRFDEYVIDARKPEDGTLDFAAPQPADIFGMQAITGITEDRMASVVFRHQPEAVLTGDRIAYWPALIDPRFRARRKTW